VNTASDSNLASSDQTFSALNPARPKSVFSARNVARWNEMLRPLNFAPPRDASSKSTPVKSKSFRDQLVSALLCRRRATTRMIVLRTSRLFWRIAWRRCSSMWVAGGVADHVVVDTNSVRWLSPESAS
jgi:hypothetical protein